MPAINFKKIGRNFDCLEGRDCLFVPVISTMPSNNFYLICIGGTLESLNLIDDYPIVNPLIENFDRIKLNDGLFIISRTNEKQIIENFPADLFDSNSTYFSRRQITNEDPFVKILSKAFKKYISHYLINGTYFKGNLSLNIDFNYDVSSLSDNNESSNFKRN
ncbi:MAG: hypothetical protein QW727_02280 [Candidatus Pacearchaeota archaeon]